MPNYKYRGWDKDRKIVKGIIAGPDVVTATEKIRELLIIPIQVEEKVVPKDLFPPRRRIREQELINFCGHMAMMIQSGVNILLSLEILEEQSKVKEIRKIYTSILEQVKRGDALSTAMESTSEFPELLVDMVRVGESTGDLDGILLNMEEYYQRDSTVRNKVKAAMIYPKILVFATFCTILFFVYFIVPAFKDMFTDMDNLPLATRLLLGVTNFFNNNTLLVFGTGAVIVLILIILRRNPTYMDMKDKAVLTVPVLGVFKRQVIISRVSRSLGVFLKSGIPVFEALHATKNIIKNRHVEKGFDAAIDRIMTGTSLSQAFEEQRLFDPMVYGLLRIGQETGRLDDMLYKLASIYDKKVEFSLTKLVARIEPLMILVIGGVVGFIIIAIAVPILSMSQNIG